MFPVQKCQLYPCRNYNNNTNNTLIYKAPEALASEVLGIQPTKLSKFVHKFEPEGESFRLKDMFVFRASTPANMTVEWVSGKIYRLKKIHSSNPPRLV